MVSFCVGGDRIAFGAESLTGQEILRTDNVEIRRIAIERLGYETFLQQVGGVIRNRDTECWRRSSTDLHVRDRNRRQLIPNPQQYNVCPQPESPVEIECFSSDRNLGKQPSPSVCHLREPIVMRRCPDYC
jgi:hypothetical protein